MVSVYYFMLSGVILSKIVLWSFLNKYTVLLYVDLIHLQESRSQNLQAILPLISFLKTRLFFFKIYWSEMSEFLQIHLYVKQIFYLTIFALPVLGFLNI